MFKLGVYPRFYSTRLYTGDDINYIILHSGNGLAAITFTNDSTQKYEMDIIGANTTDFWMRFRNFRKDSGTNHTVFSNSNSDLSYISNNTGALN